MMAIFLNLSNDMMRLKNNLLLKIPIK